MAKWFQGLGLICLVVGISGCSSESPRKRQSSDLQSVSDRLAMGDGQMAKMMTSQFKPGKSKFSEDGPLLPEGYKPPDFDKVDLGGMGLSGNPSFGLQTDGSYKMINGKLTKIVTGPGFKGKVHQVTVPSGDVDIVVPTETVKGSSESEKESEKK